jgi:hypothetical protein
MRAVDVGVALRENDFVLVRAIDVFRAQHDLPAGLDAAGGCEDADTILFRAPS